MAHLRGIAAACVKQGRAPLDLAFAVTGTRFQFAAVAFLASGIVGVLFARAGW